MSTFRIVKYIGSSAGSFNFGMALYNSASYSTRYSRGASVDVGKAIYAKIDFLSRVDLNMYVQDCYARPSQGRSPYQYDLIEGNG